jgi:hypothetical protein
MLAAWKKWRGRIRTASCLDAFRKEAVIREAVAELKPLLLAAIRTVSPLNESEITPIAVSVFLWNQEYITKRFGLDAESRCWREMLELLEELPENVLKGR